MAIPPERIGRIAGTGSLAVEFASRARKRGFDVAAVALSPDIHGSLKDLVRTIVHAAPTQPKKILSFLQSEGIRRIGFVGKVDKKILFQGLKFDFEAVRFMFRTKNLADVTIMDAVIALAEKNGFEIIPQTEFLDHLLAPEGPMGKRRLTAAEIEEVRYGFAMAREIARLDIGQTIVVKKGAVVAVEAIEGTDETIRRGCALAGAGAIVLKVARPDQNTRYDIPAVGPETLRVAAEGGASALVVEAGTTFMLEREALVRAAVAANIALIGWTGGEGK